MAQLEGDKLTTKCGKVYGVRLLLSLGARPNCPTCGQRMEGLQHDGYHGSSHAHDGAGSMGLAAHHHFAVCEECGSCDCEVCSHEHGESCWGDYADDGEPKRCAGCGSAPHGLTNEAGDFREPEAEEEVRCPVTDELLGWARSYGCPECESRDVSAHGWTFREVVGGSDERCEWR